jgi:hypothetical protein
MAAIDMQETLALADRRVRRGKEDVMAELVRLEVALRHPVKIVVRTQADANRLTKRFTKDEMDLISFHIMREESK